MKTLAKKYPDAHQAIKTGGCTNIAHMMTIFYRQRDLDNALSLNGSANGWCHMRHLPTTKSELAAEKFVAATRDHSTAPETKGAAEKAPEPAPTPSATPPAAAPNEVVTLLVVCPSGVESKMEKILALMGCEAVQM